jgi:hypothetical protein
MILHPHSSDVATLRINLRCGNPLLQQKPLNLGEGLEERLSGLGSRVGEEAAERKA